MVVVDLDTEVTDQMFHIYFQNLGRTTAHDVRLTFEPFLQASQAEEHLRAFFDHVFPVLPPGKRIESAWDSDVAVLEEGSSIPSRYTVSVTYTDRRKKQYKDEYLLDAEAFRGRMSTSKMDIGDIVRTLEKIQKSIERWSSPYGGITAVTQSHEDAHRDFSERAENRRLQHEQLVKRLTSPPSSDDQAEGEPPALQ